MAAAIPVDMRRFILAVLVFATRVAAADPDPDMVLAPPGMAPSTAPTTVADEKDPSIATLLAVAGTVAPVVIVGAAIHGSNSDSDIPGIMGLTVVTTLLLPSAGHWYAGRFFSPGMLTRSVGLSLAALGILELAGTEGDSGAGIFWTGAIVTAAGAIVDIATASGEAESYNQSHRTHVKPVALRFKTGGYGVGLGGSF
jgi:hypothetical protein